MRKNYEALKITIKSVVYAPNTLQEVLVCVSSLPAQLTSAVCPTTTIGTQIIQLVVARNGNSSLSADISRDE